MRIDFVSDVACPWCAVGLASFERALEELAGELPVELHFQPFELNPHLGPGGQDAAVYLKNKYGMSDEQLAAARANLRERGAQVGFAFGAREHVWNTFDAHRLLHWAGEHDAAKGNAATAGQAQWAMKRHLLKAYHGDSRNPAAPEVLLEAAVAAGLPADEARAVIESDRYSDAVRAAQADWQQAGIRAVPSVVINRRHLIQGGQPPEVFVQALREIAREGASAAA
jgi:predicted DsbA family dithiol-disulfide isomerase